MSKCKATGCDVVASYASEGTRRPLYCLEHKEALHVNVTSKRCQHPGCHTIAGYNLPGLKVGKFCETHAKGKDMINVRQSRCKSLGCMKVPSFDWPGRPSTGAYCGTHKEKDMVNVKKKRCNYDECTSVATHGNPTLRTYSRCKVHATDDMVDLQGKRCTECDKRPSYSHPGSPALVCADHMQPGMILSAASKKCEACPSRAIYNYPTEKKGRKCVKHKLVGMENVNQRRCKACKSFAKCGRPGSSATHCRQHAEEGMMEHSNSKCRDCKTTAIYGNIKHGPLHCDTHKSTDDINLVEHICSGCKLLTHVGPTNICSHCDPSQRPQRVAEKEVAEWLTEAELEFIHDQRLNHVNLRPDFLFRVGTTHVVILEIDERQHLVRQYQNDQARMVDIANALALRTYYIRYNPDEFRDHNGRRKVQVPKITRRTVLLDRLGAALQTPPSQPCQAEYLYFDGYDPSQTDIRDIILNDVEMKDEPPVTTIQ